MKIKFYIFVLLPLFAFLSCENVHNEELVSFIAKYRSAKSELWASTNICFGTPPQDFRSQFWSNDFTTVPGENPRYMIINNNFTVISIEKFSFEPCFYEIKGIEEIIGEYKDGAIYYFPQKRIENISYVVSFNKRKILCEYDWMYSNYYIMEKDIPLLLERLSSN